MPTSFENTEVGTDETTVLDPFLEEHPEIATAATVAAAAIELDEDEIPQGNIVDEDGTIEEESYYFTPASNEGNTEETSENDPIIGYTDDNEPIHESEYLANPDAYELLEDNEEQAMAAAASNINDPVLGVDQFGKPVFASEYYANPEAFSVQGA